MNSLGNFFGEVCKTIFPIPEEIYFGNKKSSIGICTLSSMDLLQSIANSDLMKDISLVGRLLSENKGIDTIIHNVASNPNLKTIIICGKEVIGHKAGHSLLALYNYGIDEKGRINNSTSPEPILTTSKDEIKKFQNITLINKIGITNLNKIRDLVHSISN